MILGITSLKGGAGKSTISQNLAVYFTQQDYKVCIIDTDTNQSSAQWSGYREASDINVVGMLDTKSLSRNVRMLEESYDLVIIDGTPSLSAMTNHIILLSDMLVVPLIASVLDMWATEKFLERIDEARILKKQDTPAYFVLNMYDPRLNLSKEVESALGEYPIETLKSTLAMRVAYREAVISGRGVMEYKDSQARKEIDFLGREILKKMELILEVHPD